MKIRKQTASIPGTRLYFIAICCFMHLQSVGSAIPATIMDRSPFIPPGWNPGQAAAARPGDVTSSTGYEFKGMYRVGDSWWFLVSEPRSPKGSWVELGKSYDEFEVRRFDPDSKALTLFTNNQEQTIELAQLDSNPVPIPVAGPVTSPSRAATPQRIIRPTVPTAASGQRSAETTNKPPPPAWLEKLRSEAAERREQALQRQGGKRKDQSEQPKEVQRRSNLPKTRSQNSNGRDRPKPDNR